MNAKAPPFGTSPRSVERPTRRGGYIIESAIRGTHQGGRSFFEQVRTTPLSKKSDIDVAHINRYLDSIRQPNYLPKIMENDAHHRQAHPPATVGSAVYAKYGEASIAGFQAVPDLLLKNQAALGLSATDLVVLLNVLMHWWYPAQKPFPRSTIISARMGISSRTVQRSINELENAGLLVRVKDDDRTYLDPAPLVAKLIDLAKSDTDYQIRRKNRDSDGVFG